MFQTLYYYQTTSVDPLYVNTQNQLSVIHIAIWIYSKDALVIH